MGGLFEKPFDKKVLLFYLFVEEAFMKQRMEPLIEGIVGLIFLILFILYCAWLVITGRGKKIDCLLGSDEY